jgi:hypothetical protein
MAAEGRGRTLQDPRRAKGRPDFLNRDGSRDGSCALGDAVKAEPFFPVVWLTALVRQLLVLGQKFEDFAGPARTSDKATPERLALLHVHRQA